MRRARGLRLIALICILMMPLQFKGGAAEAHPHAFFQFWSNAESAEHHHGAGVPTAHQGERGRHADPANQVAMHPDGSVESPLADATVGSPGMIGIGQVSGFAIAFSLLLSFLLRDRLHAAEGQADSLIGRAIAPPVPPPQIAAA